jgi:hypothetical protein
MRKYLIVFLMVFFVSCNVAQFASTVMLKDSKGNKYAITTVYNNTEHKVGISIAYDNLKLDCEAIYDPDFNIAAMLYEIDLDILAKSGMAVIGYKGQKYSCKVSV